MRVIRGIRIGAASFVSLIVLFSSFLVGCVTKGRNSSTTDYPVVCDPVPPPVAQICDPVPSPVCSNILFDLNRSAILPGAEPQLNEIVKSMKEYPGDTVLLEGHTCDLGSQEYNVTLGLRRADAVKAYLVGKGVAQERIQVQSFGELYPLVSNNDTQYKKLNRCVTIKFIIPKE
mgnify:CR=1 FL=1